MTGTVLHFEELLDKDQLALNITEKWLSWDSLRMLKKNDWEEIRRYVYATSTRDTSNSKNPWRNSTTVPKLCQIRDNLYSNYTATLFPKRKWLIWEANEKDANSREKRDSITNYMSWVISQPEYKHELDKVILDYIDFGNCFVTVDWVDRRVQKEDGTYQSGFVGPVPKRISPLDIVFNPVAENFVNTPKIIRSLISMGELKKMLSSMASNDNREEYENLYNYLKEIRNRARSDSGSDWSQKDRMYIMEGFTSYREYLCSDEIEVLTFYGDLYDPDTDAFLENHVITVVDRHKLINKRPNPSFFGYPPIFHCPWRKRQDNLWGMGPLDNLVGMQYRLDHIENMKADIFDLVTYPVQKVKGFVEDFTWQPGEKIFVSEEGDVELVAPDVQALNANMEIQHLEAQMEEMAGAPKEAMGFRSPGEKTAYEVQRLENASSRIYQNKIGQFQEFIQEPELNAELELAKRTLTGPVSIKVFDNQFNFATFQTLTVEDITGAGRIKPVAARHFAEQAETVQNLSQLAQSPIWQTVMPHMSSVQIAKMFESIFNLEDYEIVIPYIALAEQAEGQKQANALQEQVHAAAGTATGIGHDFDLSQAGDTGLGQGAPSPEQMMQGQ